MGGGYLSIDEFLDQYTPTELEKLERNSPMKKFSERIAVSKTLAANASPRAKASPSKRQQI